MKKWSKILVSHLTVAPLVVCVILFSVLCWGNLTATAFFKLTSTNTATNVTAQSGDSANETAKVGAVRYAAVADSMLQRLARIWDNQIFQRGRLAKLDANLTYRLTGELMSPQVLLGKEHWLFYQSRTDADSIADYEGSNQFTKDELWDMFQKVNLVQTDLESSGVRFALVIPPNKENVYAKYMPDSFYHAEVSRTDKLIEYLAAHGIHVVSPKSELLDNLNNYQLYYPYDTHWNELGAYIGVRDTLALWGIALPELSERVILSKSLAGTGEHADLAKMCGLTSVFDNQYYYHLQGTETVDWTRVSNKQVSCFDSKEAPVDASVLLVGDSFREAMIPALSATFSHLYVVHRNHYSPDILSELKPDYCIAVYVERYSMQIKGIDSLTRLP